MPDKKPSKKKSPRKTSGKTPSKTLSKTPLVGRVWRRLFYWGLVVMAWGGIALAGLVFYYALDLPATDDLWKASTQAEMRIYADNDKLMARRGRKRGTPLRYDDLPAHLVDAVIATEDRRFFSHLGLDPRGLLRATWQNIRAGRVVQGGSTLTQQLAKNVFLTPERSLKRKVQELLLALWLEARFSKQDILALYLNRVYFGSGAYGIGAAAEIYFNKPVQSLTLNEAALLAGLLKAPSRYAPTRNPEGARGRRQVVANAMLAIGVIDEAEAAAIAAAPVGVVAGARAGAHYAVDWTLEQLPGFIGRPRSDLDVITTLDGTMQLAAERAIKKVLGTRGDALDVGQAAMIVMTPDGAIRAMVGGRSYAKSQFNRAVLASRQPGSAFKPIVYMAGLEAGFKKTTPMLDAPITIGEWSPKNYGDTYIGDVDMEESLVKSLNTVAVRLSEAVGREAVLAMARRLGLTTYLAPHPSIALGAFEVNLLELTTSYAHFANGGYQVLPYVIDAVITSSGNVLYEHTPSAPPRVLSPAHVRALNDMLVSAVKNGTGRRARLRGVDVAGKTGTTNDHRDAWFVGFTGALVAGVWVGNDDGTPMARVSGGSVPSAIWHAFMSEQKSLNDTARLPDGRNENNGGESLLERLFGN